MKTRRSRHSSTKRFAAAVITAAAAGGAVMFYAIAPTESPEPVVAPVRVAPEPAAPSGNESRSELAEAPPAAPSFVIPTFDVVRIDRDGNAVIAGRASPGSEVTVQAGEDVVGTATADDRGAWVLVPETRLESGSQTLSLRARGEEGETARSDEVVVMVIPRRDGTGAGSASGEDAAEPRRVVAVATPREAFGASRVLQGPTASPGVPSDGAVRLSTVDYDERGRSVLAGVAPPESEVRVEIDGRAVGSTVSDETGRWELTPATDVAVGRHVLSVRSVDDAGRTVASTALPFIRADVAGAGLQPGGLLFTVQPGNSLWRIARATYGQGTLYTVIYSANTEQIEDPDLIYPGQVFALPPRS